MKKIEISHLSCYEKKTTSYLSQIYPLLNSDELGWSLSSLRCKNPKFIVENNRYVQIGTPILEDIHRPFIRYLSPASGNIQYEENLFKIQSVEDSFLAYQKFSLNSLKECSPEFLKNHIIFSGFWTCLIDIKTSETADPQGVPEAIYISIQDDEPDMPYADLVFKEQSTILDFEMGFWALQQLAPQSVFVSIPYTAVNLKLKLRHFITHEISGDYPANQPGVFAHYAAKKKLSNIWTIKSQDLLRLGFFLRTGHYPTKKLIKVSGIETKGSGCFLVRDGFRFLDLLESFSIPEKSLCVAGGLFTGRKTSLTDYLGPHDYAISFVPTTNQQTEPVIDCIGCSRCANTCAVNLFPQLIYKKTLQSLPVNRDLENCVFCGLCTLSCPSHIPLQALFMHSKKNNNISK